jgi:hypothetical protein
MALNALGAMANAAAHRGNVTDNMVGGALVSLPSGLETGQKVSAGSLKPNSDNIRTTSQRHGASAGAQSALREFTRTA